MVPFTGENVAGGWIITTPTPQYFYMWKRVISTPLYHLLSSVIDPLLLRSYSLQHVMDWVTAPITRTELWTCFYCLIIRNCHLSVSWIGYVTTGRVVYQQREKMRHGELLVTHCYAWVPEPRACQHLFVYIVNKLWCVDNRDTCNSKKQGGSSSDIWERQRELTLLMWLCLHALLSRHDKRRWSLRLESERFFN